MTDRDASTNHQTWAFSLYAAQAALAVGAVKEGHATATIKGRNCKRGPKPSHRNKTDLDCNFGEPIEDFGEARRHVRSPGESLYPERRVPGRPGGEFSCRPEDGASERKADKKENPGSRGVPSAGGNYRAEPFSRRDHQATYGRDSYHDSRREVELMPTLREAGGPLKHPGSPVRSRPPSRLQQTAQGQEDNFGVKFEPTATRRMAHPLSPNTVTTRVETEKTATAKQFGDTAIRLLQNIDEHARGTVEVECPSTEHGPKVKKATRVSSKSGRKHRAAAIPLTGAPHDNKISAELCYSTDVAHCYVRARGAGTTKETTDRVATTTAAADVGCSVPKERMTFNQTPSPLTVARLKDDTGQATTSPGYGPTPTAHANANVHVPNAVVARETSRPSVSLSDAAAEVVEDTVISEQNPVDLSKRRGTLVARNVAVSIGASADVQPVMAHSPVLPRSLKRNDNDRKEVGVLSPAPCHGGSPFGVPSSTTLAASEGLKGPPCRAFVHLGKQPAEPLPGLEIHAADKSAFFHPPYCQSIGFATDTSSGAGGGQTSRVIGPTARPERDRKKHSTLHTDQKMILEKPLRPGWSLDGRKCEEGLDGNGRVPPPKGYSERREEGLGHETGIDNATVNFEAASATIFEELLEPRVVAVYSR